RWATPGPASPEPLPTEAARLSAAGVAPALDAPAPPAAPASASVGSATVRSVHMAVKPVVGSVGPVAPSAAGAGSAVGLSTGPGSADGARGDLLAFTSAACAAARAATILAWRARSAPCRAAALPALRLRAGAACGVLADLFTPAFRAAMGRGLPAACCGLAAGWLLGSAVSGGSMLGTGLHSQG